MKTYLKKWKVQGFLAVFVSLPFLIPLLGGKVIYWGVASLQFIPWESFSLDTLFNGHFPLWNPYNGMGAPFLANYQSALFYPLNWLLIPFYKAGQVHGLALGYSLLLVLHLVIAAVGFSLLLRLLKRSEMAQFMGAFCWVFGGYMISRISFISMVWAFAWVSWILLFVLALSLQAGGKFRNAVCLSVCVALQLLAGHAQTSAYTLALAALLLLIPLSGRMKFQLKPLLIFISSVAFSVALAAVQLLPTLEYLRMSQRSSEVGYEYATNFSFWPARIISLLFGNFFGNPGLNRFFGDGTFWEDQIYHGVFAVLFVFLFLGMFTGTRSKKAWLASNKLPVWLLIIVIFAYLLALGKNSFLYPLFYRYVPGIDLFQAPSRFLLIFTFAVCVLLAFGADYWRETEFNPWKTGRLAVAAIAILLASVIFYFSNPTLPLALYVSVWLSSGLILLFSVITILRTFFCDKHLPVLNFILIALFVLDLVVSNFPFGHFRHKDFYPQNAVGSSDLFPAKFAYINAETEDFLKFQSAFRFERFQPLSGSEAGLPLVLPDANLYPPRYGMLNNFDPFVPARYAAFMEWLNDLPPSRQGSVLTMAGVNEIFTLDPFSADGIESQMVTAAAFAQWFACAKTVREDQILNELAARESNTGSAGCVLLEEDLPIGQNPQPADNPPPEISVTRSFNGAVALKYNSAASGWLVLRQTWYPGWQAFLNDTQILEIEQVDYLFQGVYVPAGENTINFTYRPKSFNIGAMVSMLSLMILIFGTIFFWMKNKRKRNLLGAEYGTSTY